MVGVVRIGELEIRIEPKIGMRNLLVLMETDSAQERWYNDTVTFGDDEDMLIGFVRVFSLAVGRALQTGIRRDYRPQHEPLVSPRGRIDFPAQFASPLPTPMRCRFDEHTTDIELNRLVYAALATASTVPGLPAATTQALRHHLTNYHEVTGPQPHNGWFRTWRPSRLDQHWYPVAAMADLLLRRLTLTTHRGGRHGHAFLLDMNELFERFVTNRLRRLLAPHTQVIDQHTSHLAIGNRLEIRPDLTFHHADAAFLVADCKYKIADDGRGRMPDYYQALSYATALGLANTALIYHADQRGAQEPRPAQVRNSPITIHTWPIDLRGAQASIDQQLETIAARIDLLRRYRRVQDDQIFQSPVSNVR